MNDRLVETLIIIGWVVFGCAIAAILAMDLYHRYYKPPDDAEMEAMLDQADELNDEAGRLNREAADDIDKVKVKIDVLEKIVKNDPDFDKAEFDRRITSIKAEFNAIEEKTNDIKTLIDKTDELNNIVESHRR